MRREVRCSRTAVIAAMLLSISAPSDARQPTATMPRELIGEWEPQPQAAGCGGVFTVKRDGYSGMQDSEGYGCSLVAIKEQVSNNSTWNAKLLCSGEDPRKVKMTATFNLRQFEGKDLLVVAEQGPRGASTILVLRRCPR
jgi:hypothetical protein